MRIATIFSFVSRGLMLVASVVAMLAFAQIRVSGASAGGGERVMVLRMDIGSESGDPKQSLIARMVDALFAQSVEEAYFRERSRYGDVFVKRSRNSVPGDVPKYNDLLKNADDLEFRYILLPQLEISELGYALRVATIDVQGATTAKAYFDWRNGINLDKALLGPDVDFGQLEEKLARIAQLIVDRITTGRALGSGGEIASELPPLKTVIFSCVFSIDPEDSKLVGLGRFLTLRMPAHLTRAAKRSGKQFKFLGLSPMVYFYECHSRGTISDPSFVPFGLGSDAVITADLFRDLDKGVKVSFLLSTGDTNNTTFATERFEGESFEEMQRLAEHVFSALTDAILTDAISGLVIWPINAQYSVLKNATVRAEPSTDTEAIGKLHGGKKVFVLGTTPDENWYRIRLPNHKIGYVHAKLLRPQ